MTRRSEYRSVDPKTDHKMITVEFVLVIILIGLALTAVILIIMGLGNDLVSGNRSFEVKVEEQDTHNPPTLTFCPMGASENTLPAVIYCGFNYVLQLKAQASQEREWGDQSNDCPADMVAQGINIWRRHPLEPQCWVLSGDTDNALIPARTGEVMYVEFAAEGIAVRIWNSTADALAEFPSNSSLAQGLRAIFGAGDLIQLTEGFLQRLGGPREISYEVREFGSFPLAAVGEDNASVVAVSWATDKVTTSREKETVSPLTLAAILLGAVIVVVELILRNFVLISYQLFFYVPPESQGHKSDPYQAEAK